MSQLKGLLTERYNIEKELKRLQSQMTPLRKRKQKIDAFVMEYAEKKNISNIPYFDQNGKTTNLVLGISKKRQSVKKKEKEGACKKILENAGISSFHSQSLLDTVVNTYKGPIENKEILKKKQT